MKIDAIQINVSHVIASRAKYVWKAALVLVFGGVALTAFASAGKLDAVIRSYGENKNFAGVVWIQERENVIAKEAFGFANREQKLLHSVDERFRIASITKLFAATLAMKAVDEGKVSLDKKVSEYGTELAKENAAQITIRQLLQHTSGLPDPAGPNVKNDEISALYLTKSAKFADPKFIIRERMKGKLLSLPGSKFNYNNGDYLVLQRVLEKIYKKPFAEILKDKVLDPLSLRNTGMLRGEAKESAGGFPKGYELMADKIKPEPNIAIENFGAAGAMYSTASDLATFAMALTSGKLLSTESTKAMLTGDEKLGYAALGAWVFPLQIEGLNPAPQMLAREGEIGTFKLSLIADAQRQRAIFIMTNQSPNPIGAVWAQEGLMFDLLQAWYREK
jgi:CubicO group peptidase (beta-lactamase class C family)